jgi:predicted DsbA family dithiol-disulfide isomerase
MSLLNPKKLNPKIKIEMVHDIVCSWCPIGYNNIQAAIKNLNIDVDFYFLPFQLNPNISEKGELIASYFSRQLGWNERKLLDYQQSLVITAAEADVVIDFTKRTHYYNSQHAHLLMHWAEQFNKQTALNTSLINAYFKDGQNISDLSVLLNIAEKLGLDKQKTNTALTSNEFLQSFNKKIARYQAWNIGSVPAFIFNEDTLISGSNSVQFFENVLSTIINKSTPHKC